MKRVLLIAAAWCAMSIGSYAQCAAFPCVVATTSLTNQKHGIAPTVLYTPSTDGIFRLNAYLSASNSNAGLGIWELALIWRDRMGEKHTLLGAPPTFQAQGTFPMHAVAGQPLEFRTFATGNRSLAARSYDVFIVVEQLQ